MKSRLLKIVMFAAAAAVLLTDARAVTCYALTDTDHLLKFDSATPGTATDTTITGLPMGYTLVGIDFRTTTKGSGAANPGVGSLWAIGTDGTNFRLFVLNPSTGAASAIGGNLSGITDAGAGDNGWGFGFDPAKDLIRFIGFRSNQTIDPNTLAVNSDPIPSAQGNDNINLNGAAYTTASFGGTSQAYSVDDNNHTLITSANLSASGAYATVGAGLGFTNTTPNGLDIYQDVTLWAGQPGGTSSLFNVNRSTGVATKIADLTGNPIIRGLAILPPTFPPKLAVTAKISGPKKVTTTKSSRLIKGTAKSEAGIEVVEYKIGKAKFKKAKGTKKWKFTAKLKPGKNVISVRATGGNGVKSKIVKVTVTRE